MTKKALSLAEFNDLPDELKFDILHKHGVYVGKRKDGNQIIVLFQLHGFYVEVFYTQYRKIVDRIFTSDNPEILQPYLNQINIKGFNNGKDDNSDAKK
jgi:hypothetical protein